ncbi:MAG: PAS domain-containing protein [Acidobacteriales bacterium]|nr:PAS domain-containing protein [Terriglobales bacterium]
MNDEPSNSVQKRGSDREDERCPVTLPSSLPGMSYRCRNNRDRTIEFVSDGCKGLTGYEATDLVKFGALNFKSLVGPADQERIWNEVQQALERRLPYQVIYRMHTADGEEKWVLEQGVGIHCGGELEALEGFITDITILTGC